MSASIDRISTSEAPPPFGHYVQGTAWRDLIFVSGQLAASPDGSSNSEAPFETQVQQALENMLGVIRAAGSGPEYVLKVTAYLVGVENWPAFNKLFAKAFGETRPARVVVPVPALHNGYLIELEAIALRP